MYCNVIFMFHIISLYYFTYYVQQLILMAWRGNRMSFESCWRFLYSQEGLCTFKNGLEIPLPSSHPAHYTHHSLHVHSVHMQTPSYTPLAWRPHSTLHWSLPWHPCPWHWLVIGRIQCWPSRPWGGSRPAAYRTGPVEHRRAGTHCSHWGLDGTGRAMHSVHDALTLLQDYTNCSTIQTSSSHSCNNATNKHTTLHSDLLYCT